MGRLTQENVRHCFPFVWCEGGHVNERLYSLVLSGTNDCPSVGVPTRTISPPILAKTRSSAPTSSLRVVSGIGAQTTSKPCFCSGTMILVQLAHSAQAP